MFILIYGQDTYRARERLKEIIANYQKQYHNDISIKTYYLDRECLDEIKLDIGQQQIFNKRKLIIFVNVFSSQGIKDYIAQKLKELKNTSDIFIIFQEGDISSKDLFLKLLREKGSIEKFNFLEGEDLKTWIKEKFKMYNTKIENKAVERLVQYIGSDCWRLSNEIWKLATFCLNKEVRVGDIEFMIEQKIELDIFLAIDALAQKNKKKALNLLKKHLKNGATPLYLLSMITYQFRNLIFAKVGIIDKSRLHPFVVRKSKILSQKFTLHELKKIYYRVFETDVKIKLGFIEPELALDLLVSEI